MEQEQDEEITLTKNKKINLKEGEIS